MSSEIGVRIPEAEYPRVPTLTFVDVGSGGY